MGNKILKNEKIQHHMHKRTYKTMNTGKKEPEYHIKRILIKTVQLHNSKGIGKTMNKEK